MSFYSILFITKQWLIGTLLRQQCFCVINRLYSSCYNISQLYSSIQYRYNSKFQKLQFEVAGIMCSWLTKLHILFTFSYLPKLMEYSFLVQQRYIWAIVALWLRAQQHVVVVASFLTAIQTVVAISCRIQNLHVRNISNPVQILGLKNHKVVSVFHEIKKKVIN